MTSAVDGLPDVFLSNRWSILAAAAHEVVACEAATDLLDDVNI